jgi:hypothetical protein
MVEKFQERGRNDVALYSWNIHLGFCWIYRNNFIMWFKGFATIKNPNIRNTMKIEYTTKKDLIKQIESKGLQPLSMNATIEDFKKYLNALNVEAKRKEVIKNVS